MRIEVKYFIDREEARHVGDVINRVEPKTEFTGLGHVVSFAAVPWPQNCVHVIVVKNTVVEAQEGWS